MDKEHNYENLYLRPRKTVVDSRKECDTSVMLGGDKFIMPLIPANMMSVIDEETCKYLAEKRYFYIMHRFNVNPVEFTFNMHNAGWLSSISVGVNEDSYRQLRALIDSKNIPDYITIDIAHCWCPKGERMIKFIKDKFPDTFLIAGNVASADAVIDLENWGADCIKLFVGPGKVCTTKLNTGFTRGTVSCLKECASVAKTPLIADGGIREVGDIAKALSLGATMVMAGSMLAGFDQSAGEIVVINGHKYKEYFGSSTEQSKGKNEHIEGKKILVDYKGDMDYFLKHAEESLKSSISYAGGRDLSSLPLCEHFILS